ncbi:hypothetical protein PHLCEN_2v3833 [Hermanssonia centrifuga]|uniref:Uncharacterized protein n=1 Tax=Hermanssonia centrifuga TaxID=98765 RepID=A0A2R6QBD8_9APHY|nr:hypothetical protein PHLCEN_2v3833 [Hermanssonia centrifuga]
MSEPNTEYRSFSEDDVVDPGPSESSKAPRRGTRGPSFKRGPPKGYIHAIEQRWHQVECILGTIMASPRAQSIVADLRQDSYARDVLERVDSGPYGPAGRAGQPAGTARDSAGFYNTIMNQSQQGSSYDDRRSKRQSRMTREFVSNQDSPIPAVPTMEWQDQLYRRLSAPSPGAGSPETPYSTMSDNTRFTSWSSSSDATSPTLAVPTSAPGISGEPGRRRRRIDNAYHGSLHPDQTPTHMYKSQEPSDDGEYAEAVDALGHLSVDDNQEIRYHGKSAGLHLLARSGRTDDSEQNENGIW